MACLLTDLVKPCVEKLIDKLIDGAIGELRYVCCFTSIAEKYKEERPKLEAVRRTVEQRVKVELSGGTDIPPDVRQWENEADELLQEDIETKNKRFLGFCPYCVRRYKRGKELTNKIEKMKQSVDKGDKLEIIGIRRPLPDVVYHSPDYIRLESRESKYTELLEALKDENNFITGLYGMGGSGKTTLAREVGKQLKESKIFDVVIDTTVSNAPNIKKIQDEIAGLLGLKWEDCPESLRPRKLRDRLTTDGQKILVILDDVWDQKPPIDFDAIGIPRRGNHKGCRVLVTTRDEQVLRKMGCDARIKLEVLSEDDAWRMFGWYAGISDSSPQNLIEMGRKIADECKRLPIAIKVVASSLKGQHHREHEWNAILKSLKKPVSMHNVDDDLVDVYKCLRYSYDYLKHEKAKRLFLLCSGFPEDAKIDSEILTRLAIGAGLFGEDYVSYDDARDQVFSAKNKLLDSCLLEADERYVKMHDLVRDAAQWIANEEIRTINMSHKDPKSLVDRVKNTKCLFLEGKVREMFSSNFGGSKLEILIAAFDSDGYRDCEEVPNSFFENMAGLRALHLDHKWSSYPQLAFSLPKSIQSLMNIRSLLVTNVDLGDISVLGNLQCLETLDLNSCKITELPHEITKLQKFKLLKLEKCEIKKKNPFEVIGRCISLEELCFINSFNGFCREISLPTLQRYVITDGKGLETLAFEWDGSLSKFVGLYYVDADVDIFSEATLKYFIQTADVLALDSIKWRWRNIIPEIVPVDQSKNDLVKLSLDSISELQYLINTNDSPVPNVFSKLVVLTLYNMKNLEELCNGPISFDSLKELRIINCVNLRSLFKFKLDLCNLKTMTVRICPLLVSLFQLSTAQSLMMLEELEIGDCEQLESIITDEKRGEESVEEILVDDGDNDNNKKGSSMFPKLKVLDIEICPKLEFVLPFISGDLPVLLETISIESCDKLKYIFDQFVKFGPLKELKLFELPNFIDIFPESCHLMPLFAKGSSSSLRDGFKAQTQLDPIKCNVFSWTQRCCYGLKYKNKLRSTTNTKIPLVSKDQPQHCPISLERAHCFSRQLQILCNITTINLSDVSKIKSVFILSTARRMLLETLIIENCDELKHIIVDIGDDNGGNNSSNVFPRLKELYVDGCEQLEYIFGHCADDHQSHNEIHLHLPELKSLRLEKLPSFVAMSPKQYHTTIPSLVKLGVKNNSIEYLFFLDETNGQPLNLMLQNIELEDLHVMTYLFVGPKSSVTLQNLTEIDIKRCEKLEIIFSTSVVRCFPQLRVLRIEKCEELKHIIEDDAEDEMVLPPGTCFPKLETLLVVNCNKLEFVFPVSICKELHKLKVLMIREADALQEIFRSKDAQTVEVPNLKVIVFVNLPSLSQTQAAQFQNVEHRLVENCQKLSLTSVSTLRTLEIYNLDDGLYWYLGDRGLLLPGDSEAQDICNYENPSAETTKDFATSGHELSSSQELVNNKESTGQQHPLGETDTTNKPSEINSCLEEISIQEASASASTSEKDTTTIMSTNSETRSKPKQESFKTSVEDGTTSDNVETLTSSHEVGYGKISIPSLSTSQTNDQRVMDGNPNEGNPSQTVESLSSSSLITWELQQLVSKKRLSSENMSLLTDFLVKHPSVRLMDNSLSNRYKGYAYNCLAELLKFLQTHSVLDVLEPSRSEFVELLQDARRCGFDKGWLDGIEKRALLPDLQDSQDALEKLFHSKQQVSQHLEDLKHQMTSCEAELESIIQQEAQVLESRATLSAPLGY